jgi:hypothetical protein
MLEACARLRSLLFSSVGFSLRQRNAAALSRCLARSRLRSLVCKNVTFKRTTPALRRLRGSSHVASCGTGRNACATENRVNSAIVPSSFAGHGMSKIPHVFAGPCPYCRVGGGGAGVARLAALLLLAPRPCLAAFSASRIAPQCLQTATLGFTFSPHAGQSAKRVGT